MNNISSPTHYTENTNNKHFGSADNRDQINRYRNDGIDKSFSINEMNSSPLKEFF